VNRYWYEYAGRKCPNSTAATSTSKCYANSNDIGMPFGGNDSGKKINRFLSTIKPDNVGNSLTMRDH